MNKILKNKGVIGFYLILILATAFLIYDNERYEMKEVNNEDYLIAQK